MEELKKGDRVTILSIDETGTIISVRPDAHGEPLFSVELDSDRTLTCKAGPFCARLCELRREPTEAELDYAYRVHGGSKVS